MDKLLREKAKATQLTDENDNGWRSRRWWMAHWNCSRDVATKRLNLAVECGIMCGEKRLRDRHTVNCWRMV